MNDVRQLVVDPADPLERTPARRAAGSEARVDHQPAFVLHSYAWRETSLIVEVLSRDFGRMALVARGATNREIGTELFMAEKTASVHVSRILAKLDVRSRTEAAAVAHRLGLATG